MFFWTARQKMLLATTNEKINDSNQSIKFNVMLLFGKILKYFDKTLEFE